MKSLLKSLTTIAALLLLAGSISGAPTQPIEYSQSILPSCADLGVLIPLYSYPNWDDPDSYLWDEVASAASRVPVTAIINPHNGPEGCLPNSDYIQGITDLRAGGVEILGYVYTSYAARDSGTVKAEVDLYDQCFGIDGIFFDEASSSADELAYYSDLYTYVKSKPNLNKVILNPGIHTDEGYFSTPATDTAVIFESQSSDWSSYNPDAYLSSYPPNRTAMLAYDTPDANTACAHIDLARQRGIGNVYITDDVLPNPWDSLPTFWASEIECIERLNTCTINLPLVLAGFE
jgi:hypothetical protein